MTGRAERMNLRMCSAITAIAPPGVGRWPEAWKLTAEADRRWIRALKKWEQNENAETTAELRVAFDAFLEAWKAVVVEWRRQAA